MERTEVPNGIGELAEMTGIASVGHVERMARELAEEYRSRDTALEEAMRLKEYRTEMLMNEAKAMPLVLARVDMEADVEALYSMIKEHADSSGALTFSHLRSISHKDDALLDVFMPMLFLANRNRIFLLQENFFREIVISLN